MSYIKSVITNNISVHMLFVTPFAFVSSPVFDGVVVLGNGDDRTSIKIAWKTFNAFCQANPSVLEIIIRRVQVK